MKRVLECRHDEPPLRQQQGGEWDELIRCMLLPAGSAVARYTIVGAARDFFLFASPSLSLSFAVHIIAIQKRTVIALR
jgi:hypothetical protein